MFDKEFLQWFYDRCVEAHCESPTSDYMLKFKAIIAATPEKQYTATVDEN